MIRFAHASEAEDGFTLIEVVLATVITGLIAVPLLMSVYIALKTIPQSDSRTQRASERFFLTDTFARDAANAATITVPGDGTTSWACPSATATTTQKFYEAKWTDGAAVTVKYEVTFSNDVGTLRNVVITRTENGGAPKTVATGLCDWSAYAAASPAIAAITVTNRLVEGDLHRRVKATLKLMPRADLPVEVTDLEGALGKTR